MWSICKQIEVYMYSLYSEVCVGTTSLQACFQAVCPAGIVHTKHAVLYEDGLNSPLVDYPSVIDFI